MPNILQLHFRQTGTLHSGLRSIKPTNKTFEKLMSYLSYILMTTTDTRPSKATADVRVHIKNINLNLKNHTFDGTEPIRVFYFLARFVNGQT